MNNTLMIINILSVTYYTFTGIVFIFILLGLGQVPVCCSKLKLKLDVTPDDILVTTCTLEINSCKKILKVKSIL